jgi:hypothetical protein
MADRFKYQFAEDSSAPDLESSGYQRYTLDKGINSAGAVSFIVDGHHEAFIDPRQCYLKTVFRVVKGNGDTLPPDAQVFLTDCEGINLWQQVGITLNNTPIPPGNDYPYVAKITALLGTSGDHRSTVMGELAGFRMNPLGSSLVSLGPPTMHLMGIANVANSAECCVYDKIYSDFLNSCVQLLPNRMQLGITLTRAKDSMVLASLDGDEDYKVEVMSCSLFVKRVYPNPAAKVVLDSALAEGGKLHYRRLQAVALPCAKGSRSWSWHNCFNGVAPRRAFMALINQESYYGSFQRMSNYLETAQVSTVRFSLDGREILPEPYHMEYKYTPDGMVDAEGSDVKSPFHGLTMVSGALFQPYSELGLSKDEFLRGATIYAVDLAHSETAGPTQGSFDVSIEFASGLAEPMTVLVIGEYPKTLVFDANRALTKL